MEEWKSLTCRSNRKEGLLVFIGCGKKKHCRRTAAGRMYQGVYFRSCLTLAKVLTSKNNIYILSAKYGMLSLEEEIEPYELRLSGKSKKDKEEWRRRVFQQIEKLSRKKRKIFICSIEYHKSFEGVKLLPVVAIGKQMQWIKKVLQMNKKPVGRLIEW